MDGFAVIPATPGSAGFVELSRSRLGRVFEKHILNYGPLLYPGIRGGKIVIDDNFADRLIQNFAAKVCDIVQVPLSGANNEHTEDPTRNIGEVIGLVKRDNKIFAQIDVRDDTSAAGMGRTLLGASAFMHLNYTDTRSGHKVGPTLLHVAITNRPYIPGLDDYTELLAASADGMTDAAVLTAPTSEEPKMLDDLIAELKADHGIDVPALQETTVALSAAINDAFGGSDLVALSNAEPTTDDIVTFIKGAGEKYVALSAENATLKEESALKGAEAHVDELVRSGHITPAARDAQVKLFLSNSELFDELLPEKPLVRLSNTGGEFGITPEDETAAGAAQAEIDRLTSTSAAAPYLRS